MRTWPRPEEPNDVELVRDQDGDLYQRCRDVNWVHVYEFVEAGLPRVGVFTWAELLGFGPLTEVDPDA